MSLVGGPALASEAGVVPLAARSVLGANTNQLCHAGGLVVAGNGGCGVARISDDSDGAAASIAALPASVTVTVNSSALATSPSKAGCRGPKSVTQ